MALKRAVITVVVSDHVAGVHRASHVHCQERTASSNECMVVLVLVVVTEEMCANTLCMILVTADSGEILLNIAIGARAPHGRKSDVVVAHGKSVEAACDETTHTHTHTHSRARTELRVN